MYSDVLFAMRSLRRSLGFVLMVCAVLALGIGANTALFSVVNAVLLRPLPYDQAERLVEIAETPAGEGIMPVAYPNYLDWQERSKSYESIGIAAFFPETWKREGGAERIRAGYASGSFLATYRVSAVLGRTLEAADDRKEAPAVAVLAHDFWRSRMGGDPAWIGRNLTLGGQTYTVVGVLEPFAYHRKVDIWVPVLKGDFLYGLTSRWNHNNAWVTGRLRAEVSIEQARAELAAIAKSLEDEYPGSNKGNGVRMVSLHDWVVGGRRKPVLLLFGAVGLVLLIACVNVANLMTARTLARQQEIAVREAMGANPWRLARQMFAESLVLSTGGAALGLLVAYVAMPALRQLSPDPVASRLTAPDGWVFLFCAGVSVLTGMLFGVAPALQAARIRFYASMKDGARSSRSRGQQRLRSALVVVQVTLALVLLIGSGLLLRSLSLVLREDLGFRAEHLLTARVWLPDAGAAYFHAAEKYSEMLDRIRALPGVRSSATVSFLPLTGENSNADFQLEGREGSREKQGTAADYRVVTESYFETMGIPLRSGRLFRRSDGVMREVEPDKMLDAFRAASLAVVVNDAMARRYWPGQDALGKRFRFGPPSLQGPWCTIVGISGNSRSRGYETQPQPEFYLPVYQIPSNGSYLLVRTAGELGSLERALRQIAIEVEPEAIVMNVKGMEQVASASTGSRRTSLNLLVVFAGLALLLAAMGIYGVMAYSVGERRHEFGVRVALGATPRGLLQLVAMQGLRLTLVGIGAGVLSSFALSRFLAGMLYGVDGADPAAYCGGAVLLVLVALAATIWPARLASQADPASSLRS